MSTTEGPPTAQRASWLDRALIAFVIVWIVLLVVQNLAVTFTAIREIDASNDYGFDTTLFTQILRLAQLKIVLLVGALAIMLLVKKPYRFLLAGAAVLYAFPLGVFIEGMLTGREGAAGYGIFLSMSALLSYTAAIMLAVLWSQSRKAAPGTNA